MREGDAMVLTSDRACSQGVYMISDKNQEKILKFFLGVKP